ncbi:peptidyl-prolyl cis-trans isomerase [Bacillus suaedaesalsae]|uniref:Peptidyl-prolyl cis-trans isomerase n=1 Tax=Bacillus suaedaesalsae TaxID=2810349 RepID=A0ABS2DJF9_9BACI|nr:peptidyl-prolyl cis-trans isomerase [Bacillus suaedaesalsae]MBM6618599.1 peptidyl-prolyl cis-trans isomerase [Bacillus suaedaesalsae]
MENIILVKGKVKYPLTLDPGVWIFDDRKVDLTTYFDQEHEVVNELEAYTKSVSEHWDREIKEGAIYPPINKSVKKFEKEKILNGTFAIPVKYFIQNAEPAEEATSVTFLLSNGEEHSLPIEDVVKGLFGFSFNGKPLKENGPVHFYYGNGSNRENPITNIQGISIS